MGRRGRHRQKHFARIHAFTCGKAGFKHEHSLVGGPGFSRVVHCNDPEGFEASMFAYESNYVRTTKYTLATFLPRSFFEQFRRVANIYFLLCAILSFTPLAPYSAVSNVIPLVVVIAATMIKELVEDWGRKQQDIEVNNRKVKVNCGNGVFNHTKWRDLRVGDIVRVEKDEFFPADLILLSSSFEDAICYVETMNLDGETNLKLKQALDATSKLQEESSFVDFKATVKCEDPNPNLYTFVGTLELEQQQHPLTPQQLLLRDSKLRNTDHVYGVVIFTGNDTKVMQNSTAPPSKRSKIERRMDKIIFCLFGLLVLIAAIGSVVFGINTRGDLNDGRSRWYLRPESTTVYFDPRRAPAAAILHFFTAIMLYNYLIPISLYISIEIVKVLQSVFINQDLNMYYEEGDKPARARTSNLNEELGQVDTVLSDKTGTLTCNSMEFIKCSVAGTSYGRGITEVERSMARRKGEPSLQKVTDEEAPPVEHTEEKKTVAGYNFIDERITDGFWVNEPHADVIQKFLKTLAVCHTAIPEIDEETGSISYEAESPDESAFVIAAREMGFEFFERTQTSVLLNELDLRTGAKVERHYKLLNIIEFSSARKRMSVIVRDEDGKLLLLCKGADSVMFERLANDGREFEPVTREHINGYADAGLRTLILAYRKLSEEEYNEFNREFTEAKNAVSAYRDDLMDAAALKIEGNLTLLGATAVEDKLQNGVPECIDKLAQAGIKIWVLTGDKMETAINIGFACSLLRQGMRQITISSETPERKIIDRMEDKVAAARAAKEVVLRQLTEGKTFLTPPSTESTEALALIIDGSSLTYALEDDVQDAFLELAVGCASVICCRSSPKQKAMVTRLVKVKTGKTTLGVGDGANDVGMLQEADIGVGISGVEGMQAVMSSDFAIAQFRFLERLLLVHGHWCYKRISSMICYFFYKNIAFGMTLFFFESFTSFSSQTPYNDWYMSLYNVFFTSLPVLAMGVLDKDLSARYCLKFPLLYQEGVQNTMFSWFRISGWAFNGMMVSVMVTFLSVRALDYHAFRETGQVVTLEILGTSMYTCLVWIVNCQMALSIGYFTYIQHIFIWGEIIFWYIFMLAYGEADPGLSSTAYGAFVEACAPAPAFWLTTLTVTVSALVPYFAVSAIRMRFYPSYHQMIQWMKVDGHTEDPAYCQMVRQRSIRPTTVGSTARLAASSRRSRPSEGSPLPTT